jgi:glycosyltransferase involved in cell wall biosynthesis
MAGTGNVCYYNALELARSGHQVSVYTAESPSPSSFDPPGVTVHRLRTLARFGNVPLLPGLLRIREVDLIHLHYPFGIGEEFVWMVSKFRRIPFILTYHNDLIGEGFRRPLFDLYSSLTSGLILGSARKLAVVSADYARSCRMAPLFERRWKDVVEIPNGVDTKLFRPLPSDSDLRRKFGVSPDDRLILFVGALDRAHHFKGVSTLLEAVSKIDKEQVVLWIVGDGDWKTRYQRQAEEMGIGRRTVFTGSIPFPELPRYYSCADIVVLPSLQLESFGIVLIEAMACHKPVIASDLPGVRSVVSNGSEGFLVPPGDAGRLAERIRYLLDHPLIQQEMGIRGRAKVEAHYAWPKITPRLIRLYEDAIKNRSSSASSLR